MSPAAEIGQSYAGYSDIDLSNRAIAAYTVARWCRTDHLNHPEGKTYWCKPDQVVSNDDLACLAWHFLEPFI